MQSVPISILLTITNIIHAQNMIFAARLRFAATFVKSFNINLIAIIRIPLISAACDISFISCHLHLFLLIILANVSRSCTEQNSRKMLPFQSKYASIVDILKYARLSLRNSFNVNFSVLNHLLLLAKLSRNKKPPRLKGGLTITVCHYLLKSCKLL